MTDERDIKLRGHITITVRIEQGTRHITASEHILCDNISLAAVGTQAQRDVYELIRQVVLQQGLPIRKA